MGFLWLNESEFSSRDLSVNPPERGRPSHLGENWMLPKKTLNSPVSSRKRWNACNFIGKMLFSEEPHKKLEVPSCSWLDGSILNGSRKGPNKKKTGPIFFRKKKASTPTLATENPLALAWTLGLGVVITWVLTKRWPLLPLRKPFPSPDFKHLTKIPHLR